MTPNQFVEAQFLLTRHIYLKSFLNRPKNSMIRINIIEENITIQVNQEDLKALAELMLPKIEAALRALGVEI
jgi:hypothetical protein